MINGIPVCLEGDHHSWPSRCAPMHHLFLKQGLGFAPLISKDQETVTEFIFSKPQRHKTKAVHSLHMYSFTLRGTVITNAKSGHP
jgi:hypothetical protein